MPQTFRYNAPYTIAAWVLSTDERPVSTIASLSPSPADLATTELRLGTEPSAGLMNHNGSFESFGASEAIKAGIGQWQYWVVTFDGWKERAYLNGQLIHEQNNFFMVRPEGPVTIGADGTGTNTFQGYISQLSIEPGSVSSDEVSRRYEATRLSDIPSLGDDDFEETDPDSKFTLSPSMKPILEKREPFTLSATTANFNDAPLSNGGTICQEVEGDFVVMCRFDDMEGYRDHSAKSYNDGGLLIADADGTFFQLGVFPLYNCGNIFTILSKDGRPQYPNFKGYDADPILQFERRGDLLFARTSRDGKTWRNMPGSPVSLSGGKIGIGTYQTTYSDNPSWVRLSNFIIYQ